MHNFFTNTYIVKVGQLPDQTDFELLRKAMAWTRFFRIAFMGCVELLALGAVCSAVFHNVLHSVGYCIASWMGIYISTIQPFLTYQPGQVGSVCYKKKELKSI